MPRRAFHRTGLVAIVLAALLSLSTLGVVHAAVHSDGEKTSDCATCQWVKHTPATATEIPSTVVGLPVALLDSPPTLAAPIEIERGLHCGRAPPSSAR